MRELDEAAWRIDQEAQLYGTVPEAIEAAGGREKLLACGAVYTGAFQTQAVAWYMHLHEMESEIFAFPPGTTIAPNFSALSKDPRFPRSPRPESGSSAPPAPADARGHLRLPSPLFAAARRGPRVPAHWIAIPSASPG